MGLGLEEDVLHALLAEELDERTVFGEALIGTEEQQGALFFDFLVVRGEFSLGLGENLSHETALRLDDLLDVLLVFVEVLVVALRHGT